MQKKHRLAELTQTEKPTFEEEGYLWDRGYSYVIGLDEVGRGAFAGPLVTGAVVFPQFFADKDTPCTRSILANVHDSKLVPPQQRVILTGIIKANALVWAVEQVSVGAINKVGIGKANQIGFRRVIKTIAKILPLNEAFLLVDGFHVRYVRGIGLKHQRTIIKGDQKSLSIAAASIIAKVYRDRLMSSLPAQYQKYKFVSHKGYGTAEHRRLIRQYGLSSMHRTSFNLSKTCDSLGKEEDAFFAGIDKA